MAQRDEQLRKGQQHLFRTWPDIADFSAFYGQLLVPVASAYGPFDATTLGGSFQQGGQVTMATVGREKGAHFVTYVTCELAAYCAQRPCPVGQFEILVSANDQSWAHSVLSALGRLSFEDELDQGHSVDMSRITGRSSLCGVIFERFSTTKIGNRHFSILRAIGITRDEMAYCQRLSPIALVKRFQQAGIYPFSDVRRGSVPL